ncbi:MAG: nitroreductase family deazaflavin-dependent oxidoreductase [Chloroflexota bacterium]|nr:nitroreductase family deazaflavin-dependent oxidoreductase [Chloroflexota bacterium]
MSEYIANPIDWVANQVELYESSNGAEGATLYDLPCIIVTNKGNKTGAVRKTPLMRVVDGDNYVLVASWGGAPKHPVWYYNLKSEPNVEIRDIDKVQLMSVQEIIDPTEKARLWKIAVAAYPPYEEYQEKTSRVIPVFVASPV